MRVLRVLIIAAAVVASSLVTHRGPRNEATITPAADVPASTASLDPKPAPPEVPVVRTSIAAFGSTAAKDHAAAQATTVAPPFSAAFVTADPFPPAAPRSPSPLVVPLRI